VNCQYFGLLPAFAAVILCGAFLWWGGVVSAAKNRAPHRPASRPERKRKSLQMTLRGADANPVALHPHDRSNPCK
jgi:hypothetical protein